MSTTETFELTKDEQELVLAHREAKKKREEDKDESSKRAKITRLEEEIKEWKAKILKIQSNRLTILHRSNFSSLRKDILGQKTIWAKLFFALGMRIEFLNVSKFYDDAIFPFLRDSFLSEPSVELDKEFQMLEEKRDAIQWNYPLPDYESTEEYETSREKKWFATLTGITGHRSEFGHTRDVCEGCGEDCPTHCREVVNCNCIKLVDAAENLFQAIWNVFKHHLLQ